MDIWNMLLRLLAAAFLGSIIGLEREYRAKEAGYRTHFLVALGSATMMIVSQYGFMDIADVVDSARFDPGRIAAQVVSGIGFIGAGTIIFQKQIVRGLTTAAGIWATAGIGLAIGAGMFVLGTAATILTLVGLELLGVMFKKINLRSIYVVFELRDRELVAPILGELRDNDFYVVSYELEDLSRHDDTLYRAGIVLKSKVIGNESKLLSILHENKDIMVTRLE